MKSPKPANIAFLLLVPVVSFVVGVYLAGIAGVGKGQMLAAAAIVLGWGFLFAGIAVFIAILIARSVQTHTLVKANWGLLILLLILYGITHYRYLERQKSKEVRIELLTKPPVHFATLVPSKRLESPSNMGIGLFQPNFYEHPKLNFYGGVNLEKSLDEHLPVDSLVFQQTEVGFTTAYAPPWLFPEHMKLDYGILMFKVIGQGHDFLKVESNKQNGKIHYIDKSQGRLITWAEMLLSVNSIQPLKSSQTIHTKPQESASKVSLNYEYLQPVLVQDDWTFVKLVDANLKEVGKGWIRWKNGNQLTIKYSLFS